MPYAYYAQHNDSQMCQENNLDLINLIYQMYNKALDMALSTFSIVALSTILLKCENNIQSGEYAVLRQDLQQLKALTDNKRALHQLQDVTQCT